MGLAPRRNRFQVVVAVHERPAEIPLNPAQGGALATPYPRNQPVSKEVPGQEHQVIASVPMPTQMDEGHGREARFGPVHKNHLAPFA
jgi:hypothetical protein